MKPKVYIAKRVPEEVEKYIAEYCDYKMWGQEETVPQEVLFKEIQNVEGVMLVGQKVDDEFLAHAPELKVVSNISVGYNNFDTNAMKAKRVLGTNTPDVLNDTVADLVFGLILASARRLAQLDRYVKDGNWRGRVPEELFGVDVHHATLGIIGLGRIGEEIARRAKFGFKMKVLYHNRKRNTEAEQKIGVEYCSQEELLRQADFVVLMIPLTERTHKYFGTEQLKLMKKSAIFINASRGETTDEQALIDALQKGIIRGAGLDVFAPEPPQADNLLLRMPNVVTVPHIGSATAKTRFDMAMLAARNLVTALQGEVPPSLVEELRELCN